MHWRSSFRLVGTLILLLTAAMQAPAQTQSLTRAQAVVSTPRGTVAAEIELPYHWDRRQPGLAGTATFDIGFTLAPGPAVPMALFMPRVGNAYEIWLNGGLLQRKGDLGQPNTDDYVKAPRLVEIPRELLLRENLLRIHIRADAGRRAGLAVPLLGPSAQVTAAYQRNYVTQVGVSMAAVLVSALVAAMALALWLTQTEGHGEPHRRNSLYLLVALAEGAWAIRWADTLTAQPPLPWPQWSVLMACATVFWLGCVIVFCCQIGGWARHPVAIRLMRWGTVFLFAGAASAGLAALIRNSWPLSLWYGLAACVALSFTAVFCGAALRKGASTAHRLVAVAAALNTVAGLRDVAVFRFSDAYAEQIWLRYTSILFGLALAYIAIKRFQQASLAVHNMQAEVASARLAERSRILRDMHDGVGSHISSAIRQLQDGKASTDSVVQTLRDSMDQLKLSIDVMSLPPGDITGLLASLRYRLERRLEGSGLNLQWQVDALAPLPDMDTATMAHLQFMVFEALSNVLQHSDAATLRIEACALGEGEDAGVRLRIIDDGRGFDTERPLRKGLASMHERAAAIGARLTLRSEPGRTEVDIALRGA